MIDLPTNTGAYSSLLAQTTATLRQQVETTSQEAVTGRRADPTAHLDGRIGKAMLANKAVENITLERAQIALRDARLDVADLGLLHAQEAAGGIAERLAAARGSEDVVSMSRARVEAKDSLNQVLSSLNARHGERYLFAGDAVSTAPFGEAEDVLTDLRALAASAGDAAEFSQSVDDYFTAPDGDWFANQYQGAIDVSDHDAVSGADPAIVDLISGLALAAVSLPDDGTGNPLADSSVLDRAISSIKTGELGVINLRADIGATRAAIEMRSQALDVEETIFTKTFNDLTGRDQYEAATELRDLESRLEASYLLTTRLSNLSLLNFMR